MNIINDNLSRNFSNTQWCEEMGFLEDSGYELSTLYARARGSLERAFKQGAKVNPALGFSQNDLPPFNPLNILRVTVEVVTPTPVKATAPEPNKQPVSEPSTPEGKSK